MTLVHRWMIIGAGLLALGGPTAVAQEPRVEAPDVVAKDLVPVLKPLAPVYAKMPLEIRVFCDSPASAFVAQFADFSIRQVPDQLMAYIEPEVMAPARGPAACVDAQVPWVFNTSLFVAATQFSPAMDVQRVELSATVTDTAGIAHGPYPFGASVQVELIPNIDTWSGERRFQAHDGEVVTGPIKIVNGANGRMTFSFQHDIIGRTVDFEIIDVADTLTLDSPNQGEGAVTSGFLNAQIRVHRPAHRDVVPVTLPIIGTDTSADPRAKTFGGSSWLFYTVNEGPPPIPLPPGLALLALGMAATVFAARRR